MRAVSTRITRSGWLLAVLVAAATVGLDVGLEPLVIQGSDQLLAPFFLIVITGVVGLLMVVVPTRGWRRPVGVGLLTGTVVAFVVLVVLIVGELNSLGTTGV